jgi:hypothetical protein
MPITHIIYLMKSPLASTTTSNPRPELLVWGDDDLPVHVSHYLRDLGPEGGQDVMGVFTDLSLNFAPHEII